MSDLLPLLLAAHITMAVSLFLPSLLLPFALRANRRASDSANPLVRFLLRMQADGSVVLAVGLTITGVALLTVLGPQLLAQPWLLVALAIYAINLVVAFFIQRPNLLRLVGIRATGDDVTWRQNARRQRYVSYAMAGLVGTIGFLMSAKPRLW
jgi:hypothetical protein